MANGYKKDEIINKLENLKDISTLYKEYFINYRGDTTDTKEKYTEVIAEWLIKNNNYFGKNIYLFKCF